MSFLSKYVILTISLIVLLSGCTVVIPSINSGGDETEKNPSCIGTFSTDCSFAVIDGDIAYLTDFYREVHFIDGETGQENMIKVPKNRKTLGVTSGKYFYVYCTDEDETGGFLRMYDAEGNFIEEAKLPFHSFTAKDGILYGYLNGGENFDDWRQNGSNNYIYATHYIDEDSFLRTYDNEISEWNEITGGEEVLIGKQKLYLCPADLQHETKYYCDAKPLTVFEQIRELRYCDGRIASAENDKNVASRLDQIYQMMGKQEKNFLIFGCQTEDSVYGICNVYDTTKGFLTAYTVDLAYSFSFRYDESQDELYKINDYDVELLYEDERHCLYHTEDGVYFRDLLTGKEERVYDYGGMIGVTVVNGMVKFEEIEVHSVDSLNKQEIKKIW